MNMHVPTLQRSLSDMVAEYEEKKAALPAAIAAFKRAGSALVDASIVASTYGCMSPDIGHIYERDLERNLLTSAWNHVYTGLNIALLATPSEKCLYEQSMKDLPEFNLDNIRGTFGKYILDPRGSMLRSLAEVFCELDQAYKSHDKVKIGVAGLPKRIIMSGFNGYSYYGRDRLKVVLNALAVYQGKPLIEHDELLCLIADKHLAVKDAESRDIAAERGVTVKTFQNGNGHVIFAPATLRDVNKALADFYGNVLPDTTEERPDKPSASTAVSKDLQFYRTPDDVVERVLANIYQLKDKKVLEPSCGDGAFLRGLRKAGARTFGVEFDSMRAAACRSQGFKVLTANFLQTVPDAIFDLVVMNPPFYGQHYAKHVEHALEFLVPGGTLYAILPVTARYDHHLLDHHKPHWDDLPVGSFSESGTNINTTVCRIRKAEA
jgi:hypothetical protein